MTRAAPAALAAACALGLLAGCARPVPGLFPPAAGAPARVIHVVSHGWHTGIVVRVTDLPAGAWPSLADFPGAGHVEVGWGDRDFYQAPAGTSGLALRAALASRESVLHVAARSGDPARWAHGGVVELRLSADGLAALAAFVAATHATDAAGRAVHLGPGLEAGSGFFASGLRYHLGRTCNTWTAQALRAAGVPVVPALSVTADGVMRAAAAAGRSPGRGAPLHAPGDAPSVTR